MNHETKQKIFSVITTIQAPTECMKNLAKKWPGEDGSIVIVGDSKGPFEYELDKARLFDIESQRISSWSLSKNLPEKHYARKNLGYLEAISLGAECVFETDDDNEPNEEWMLRQKNCESTKISAEGWFNVYKEFTDDNIWPRGLPLNEVLTQKTFTKSNPDTVEAPLQQGLADGSPDVDAAWRLILDKEFYFKKGDSVRLNKGTWCPFNSQSTWWWKEAFPLMYLPSYCPFRMTDIWRGFVAQRCLWELGYELTFHAAEVFQSRNEHNYMFDFKDEVPGYLRNEEIRVCLEKLELKNGFVFSGENLKKCYEALVKLDVIPSEELALVDAWNNDIKKAMQSSI